jgi:hypothetical protein
MTKAQKDARRTELLDMLEAMALHWRFLDAASRTKYDAAIDELRKL